MPNTPDYHWPPMDKRRVMGKRLDRLDGIAKSTGAAKYNSDLKPDGMLFGALLTSPHAHAKVKSIDTSAAEKLAGVTAVRAIVEGRRRTAVGRPGDGVCSGDHRRNRQRRGSPDQSGLRSDAAPGAGRGSVARSAIARKPAGEQATGDPDKAFQEADATSEGSYGIPVLTHCCLEPHGQTIAVKGDRAEYFPSTQNVYGIASDIGRALNIPIANVHVHMDYMGGGFGSKFPADRWGLESAELSKASGGRPVKLFLDRATELTIAGNRPSVFAKVKTAAKKDGTITAWQSETWSTGGIGGGNLNAQLFPYVFTSVPNRRINHTAVSVNAGGARAWRAPSHPQVCFVTCSAFEDLAAKINMDPLDMFLKNLNYTSRADLYKYPVRESRRADRVEEELASARRFRQRSGEARSRPGARNLGRRRARQHLQNHHPSGCFGGSGTGDAGSRHRHSHHGRDDRGGNFRAAD